MAEQESFIAEPEGNILSKLTKGKTVKKFCFTSNWLQDEEMKTHVFRVFKTRRLKIEMEKIPWPYNMTGLDTWFDSLDNTMHDEHSNFLNFFSGCLSTVDIDPEDWFHHATGQPKTEDELHCDARRLMVNVMANRDTAIQKVGEQHKNRLIRKMDDEFMIWFESVTDMLRNSPCRLNKSAYEHHFESFVRLFGLCCKPGDYKKFEVPNAVRTSDDKTKSGIPGKPDLILCGFHDVRPKYVRAVPLAVVEVKSPTQLKKLKAAPRGSRKRALSETYVKKSEEFPPLKVKYELRPLRLVNKHSKCDEESQPHQSAGDQTHRSCGEGEKSQCELYEESHDAVAVGQAAGGSATIPKKVVFSAGQSEQKSYEEGDYGKLPPSADIPSPDEKKYWNNFLPQLLEEVVAAGCTRLDCDKRTSMAIAVIGYSVNFLNFCCQKDVDFDEIPLTPGAGLDIFISEELCLLKKVDRERICKLLLFLANFEDLPF